MDCPDIRFIDAAPEDFDSFFALRCMTMREHVVRVGYEWNLDFRRSYERQRFDAGFLRVIFLRDERIGFIGVRPDEDGIMIESFCLEPKHQKKGIGTRVLKKILAEPDIRTQTIRLDVLRFNHAARLYERLGFVQEKADDKLIYYVLPAVSEVLHVTPPAPACG